ncbi:MAG: FAD-binding protein, partial [Victivallales bacterium]|nr:FAD-binding protein [Victivallales bacterium]
DEHYRDTLGLTVFNATNVVLATGGPGEMYKVSVWPHGQIGSHGLALEVGAAGNNLTELQYGLASTSYRWNLSGTYQQVVPDYYSTAADGVSDPSHFLHDYFDDMSSMATNIFLKGYQWPFHAERLQGGGSSVVDIAVHREIEAGRRVFMDFMHDPTPAPGMRPFAISELGDEARVYLERSGALQSTPYERLAHMNQQSIDLYAEHDVDLREPLEVAVCAQHCNGGLRGNLWWETSVAHLFAIGELNGSHGVRPGGSALNSGQVGATRAAQFIAHAYGAPPRPVEQLAAEVGGQIAALHAELNRWLGSRDGVPATAIRPAIQERMSRAGAFVRDLATVRQALAEARALCQKIAERGIACTSPKQLARASEDRHLALTSVAFLQAIEAYIEGSGGSRGGYMILDPAGDVALQSKRGRELPHRSENLAKREEILELALAPGTLCDFAVTPVPVRPLPNDDSWYETTWAAWNRGEIYQD